MTSISAGGGEPTFLVGGFFRRPEVVTRARGKIKSHCLFTLSYHLSSFLVVGRGEEGCPGPLDDGLYFFTQRREGEGPIKGNTSLFLSESQVQSPRP